MTPVLLALGANKASNWGAPENTIMQALQRLDSSGVSLVMCSQVYLSAPLGNRLQPQFINIAVSVNTHLPPNILFHNVKKIERESGRKLSGHWSARTLDIDIVDFPGYRIGWPPEELGRSIANRGRRQRGRLILPHPQMHLRSFVLYPVKDIVPHWRHPVLNLSISRLINSLPLSERLSTNDAMAPMRSIERQPGSLCR